MYNFLKQRKPYYHLPFWKNINKTQIQSAHKSRATRTGKISGITVLDFDDKNVYETQQENKWICFHKGNHESLGNFFIYIDALVAEF